jgi:hypothetical protein
MAFTRPLWLHFGLAFSHRLFSESQTAPRNLSNRLKSEPPKEYSPKFCIFNKHFSGRFGPESTPKSPLGECSFPPGPGRTAGSVALKKNNADARPKTDLLHTFPSRISYFKARAGVKHSP